MFELAQHSVCLNREEIFRPTGDRLLCARKSFDAQISRWSLLHSAVELPTVRKTFRLHSLPGLTSRLTEHSIITLIPVFPVHKHFFLSPLAIKRKQHSKLSSHILKSIYEIANGEWRRRRWLNRVWRVQIESVMTSFGGKWNLNLLKSHNSIRLWYKITLSPFYRWTPCSHPVRQQDAD